MTADTLVIKHFAKIALYRTVSEINVFVFLQKFKMATKNGRKTNFGGKSPNDSADTLVVKHFAEIAQSHTVFEINGVLQFTQ